MPEENNPILVRKQKWLKLRMSLKERFGKFPDLNAVLMLIGIREVGSVKAAYEKEEKEELMHVGTCTALSMHGVYEMTHRDDDNWPHYDEVKKLEPMNVREQENFLIDGVIAYFEQNELL